MAPLTFTLNFTGDVMLGRLIDQLFPTHVHEPSEAAIAQSFLRRNPQLAHYGPSTPWSNVLPLLRASDLNLINLETSASTHASKWPNKVFNYRMHPANIAAVTHANIHYAGLANNHTLDFREAGLQETVRSVKAAGLAFAGAGESAAEAQRPAVLTLSGSESTHDILVWAAADHPQDWAAVPTFHSIDYSAATKRRLQALLTTPQARSAAMRIFSLHWGPNYAWSPSAEIVEMAHFLIDECGIDIVHGHSSHHVQGVETYKGKLIIYGCGDFVDDYALVPEYRNDLGGLWRVIVEEEGGKLKLRNLEVVPTKIENFAVRRLEAREQDARWLGERVVALSRELGTEARVVENDEADGLEVIVDLP